MWNKEKKKPLKTKLSGSVMIEGLVKADIGNASLGLSKEKTKKRIKRQKKKKKIYTLLKKKKNRYA